VDFLAEPQLGRHAGGRSVRAGAVDPHAPKTQTAGVLARERPRDDPGAGLGGVAIPAPIGTQPVACLAGRGVGADIVDTGAAKEVAGGLFKDAHADIGEPRPGGEGDDLLGDVLDRVGDLLVASGPGHPGEQVVPAVVDDPEHGLGVLQAVRADDEPLGLQGAADRLRGGPAQAVGGEVHFAGATGHDPSIPGVSAGRVGYRSSWIPTTSLWT
jgi:hypothetical protein